MTSEQNKKLFIDEDTGFTAMVKWDGQVDLQWKGPRSELWPANGLHVDDLDELITALSKLRDEASDYFIKQNGMWPGRK